MTSRGRKLVDMARMHTLSIPKYEATSTSTVEERNVAIQNEVSCDSTSEWDGVTALSKNITLSIPSAMLRKPLNPAKIASKVSEETTCSEIFEDVTSGSEYTPSESSSDENKQFLENHKQTKTVRGAPVSSKRKATKTLPKKEICTVKATNKTVPISMEADSTCLDQVKCSITAAVKNDCGKRIRNKHHACYFCHKQNLNVARHLEVKHSNEIEVAKLLALPKRSKKRRDCFAEISRIGDFYHNCEVLSSKNGELILVRRPSSNEIKFVTYIDYGPCPQCLGFMLKKHLWHHLKSACPKKSKEEKITDDKTGRHIMAESNAILSNVFSSEASLDYIKYILDSLKDDEIGVYSKEDQLIVKFGAMQFEKYGLTQTDLIKQWMRQLSRLVLKLRETSIENLTLTDLLAPERFDIVIQTVKQLCGSSMNNVAKRPEFAIPSLALKIGHSLKKCANIERGWALRNYNLKKDEKLQNFISLMEMEWSMRISSNALATLYKQKFNVPQLLPITEDLKKLSSFIDNEIRNIISSINLNDAHILNNFNRLAVLSLARIILFNKRRAGEASKMTVEQYTSRPSWTEQSTDELKNSLTSYEKKLAERLCIVHIIGKRGRKVPIILTELAKSAVDTLLKHRKICGICDSNPYIFPRSNQSLGNLRGHDCLRKITLEVELQKPEYITGTKLRKYVATVCQIFDLSENEYDWLARHLGHDVRVHREYYRLHEDVVELTKVSRLLLAVDRGEASSFAGKQLTDIQLKDLPPVEEEDELIEEIDIEENNAIPSENYLEKPKKFYHSEKREAKVIQTDNNRREKKQMWTDEEKIVVTQFFKLHIKNSVVPKKVECESLQIKHEFLMRRKWSDIKFYVANQIKKKNRVKSY